MNAGFFRAFPQSGSTEETVDILKPKIRWTVDRIGWVFDRDRMRGRILPVEETGNAQHSVSVRASGIATEGLGDQFERLFLTLEVEASDSPERLVFAGRSRDDRGRRGNQIGRPQRSEAGVAILVDLCIVDPEKALSVSRQMHSKAGLLMGTSKNLLQ